MPDSRIQGRQQSLSTSAARLLATTTKTIPQMVGITPRWLLHLLPWVNVEAGTYRVNRRTIVVREPERVSVTLDGGRATVQAQDLRAIPLFQGVETGILQSLARRLVSETYHSGDPIVSEGERGDKLYIFARGKLQVATTGSYGQHVRPALLIEGDHFSEMALLNGGLQSATVQARTPCLLLSLNRAQFEELLSDAPAIRANIERDVAARDA